MEKLPPPLRPGNPSTFAKMARIKTTFAALVLAQAAHSVEEYGHPLWSLRQGGYTPGVFTALVLLALAPYLAAQPRKITTSATS